MNLTILLQVELYYKKTTKIFLLTFVRKFVFGGQNQWNSYQLLKFLNIEKSYDVLQIINKKLKTKVIIDGPNFA